VAVDLYQGSEQVVPATTLSRALEQRSEGFSMASVLSFGPNIAGSNRTGVKKMPNVSRTWTMYFTSRKNRLAQLRRRPGPP